MEKKLREWRKLFKFKLIFRLFVSGCSKKYTFVHDSQESWTRSVRERRRLRNRTNDLLNKKIITNLYFLSFCSMLLNTKVLCVFFSVFSAPKTKMHEREKHARDDVKSWVSWKRRKKSQHWTNNRMDRWNALWENYLSMDFRIEAGNKQQR